MCLTSSMQSYNIYSSNIGFFYVLKLLGLAPYSFDAKNQKLKVTSTNYLQFAASVAFWIILTFIENLSKARDSYKVGIQSNLLESLWQHQFTLQHFLAIGLIVFSFVNREHVENFLSLVHNFDQHVKKLRWKVQPKQMNVWFPVIFFLLSTVVMTIYTVTVLTLNEYKLYFDDETQIFRMINYVIMNVFFLMVATQFIMSVACINQRLSVLTGNFR